ncbi:MAG: sensor domain-containing diguanylate cyclase [Leptolyngbyaceae cyanobacterium SM2_5_2]|nr:sensor domain-containing diguanylate cyclase [Leptolyngbyaceae cyanobacterium SM2_5_2]
MDYIAKPFQIEEVLARIRYQFQAHQNRHRLQLENARLQRENADQRHSLTQIDHSYQLLSQVFNCLADGIAAFKAIRNPQGEIEDFQWLMGNSALVDWLGRSPTELAGITLSELLLDHPNDDMLDLFIRVVEQHEALQYELLCEPDGRIPLWFELMASRLGDGLVARLKNITEYKQVVTRLQTMISDLQVLTTQDGLTQVANRRTFDRYFQMEWQRLARMREPLSLIMADIDQFKRFNDLCGHVVGDQCLRSVAQALAEVVKRPADMVARYGGEEFAILLPHTHLQGALQVASQIQARVKALRLAVQHRECEQVRLSLGVASQIPNRQGCVETLLTQADQALYQAKRQGGNQICLGTVDPEAEISFQPRYEEALAEEEE